MDNEQFLFGQALKLDTGIVASFVDGIKKFLLTRVKGYDLKKISVATLLFEGDKEEVDRQEKLIYEIADQYSGLKAGETNGQKGYVLTFVIAYIRVSWNFLELWGDNESRIKRPTCSQRLFLRIKI